MTKEQFIQRYQNETVKSLLDFCIENGLEDIAYDYYSPKGFNNAINKELRDMVYTSTWTKCFKFLKKLPSSDHDWFCKGDYGWVGYYNKDSSKLFQMILGLEYIDEVFEEE